jgi:monoamine oxidase
LRVVVVGAGLAGLRAAADLLAVGAHVELVEAGPRVGGRARTVRDRFTGGQYVESGAEWVDDDHPLVLELLARHGIGLLGGGTHWTSVRRMLFRDGRLWAPDEIQARHPDLVAALDRLDDAVGEIADGIADPAHPDHHPQAAVHDARSVADLLASLDLDETSTLFARRNCQGEFAEEPERISALFVAQQRALREGTALGHGARSYRLDGGISRLADAMAADVADSLSLGESVERVQWDDTGAVVHTDRRRLVADRVVLACSLVPLRAVRFDPPLPPPLAAAVHGLGYGTVTKTALQHPRRTWPAGFVNCELPSQRLYEPTIDQPGECGVVMAYTGGEGGRRLAQHDEAQRMAIVAADQRAVHGLEGAPLGGFSRAWSAEPRYGGSYAVYRPGEVTAFWQLLRAACGPLVLAGEHTGTWTGYLEGALDSADRAVAQATA